MYIGNSANEPSDARILILNANHSCRSYTITAEDVSFIYGNLGFGTRARNASLARVSFKPRANHRIHLCHKIHRITMDPYEDSRIQMNLKFATYKQRYNHNNVVF